jgi:hypothetical protein
VFVFQAGGGSFAHFHRPQITGLAIPFEDLTSLLSASGDTLDHFNSMEYFYASNAVTMSPFALFYRGHFVLQTSNQSLLFYCCLPSDSAIIGSIFAP